MILIKCLFLQFIHPAIYRPVCSENIFVFLTDPIMSSSRETMLFGRVIVLFAKQQLIFIINFVMYDCIRRVASSAFQTLVKHAVNCLLHHFLWALQSAIKRGLKYFRLISKETLRHGAAERENYVIKTNLTLNASRATNDFRFDGFRNYFYIKCEIKV